METCPICLEELKDNITITNCNHQFCDICFKELMDSDKIECPLCRSVIKEYTNNDGKVKVLLKTIIRRRSLNQNDIDTNLIRENDIRSNNIKNYFYFLLYIYIIYLYLNNSYIIYNLKSLYNNCQEDKYNLTNSLNEILDGQISVSLYDSSTGVISKVCFIPSFFYKKCFNL